MSIESTTEKAPTESEQLSAGFNDEPVAAPQEQPAVEEKVEEPTEEVKEEPVEEVKEPETVSITADQWKAMQDRLAEIDNLKAETSRRVDQALGKYGELNRTLQQMQQKPQGGLDLSKVRFEKLAADFPEFAQLIQEDLAAATQAAPVEAAPAAATPSIDPAELEQRFQAKLEEEMQRLAVKNEIRELTRRHRDWNEVVRSEAFAKWGATLPAQEWESLRASNDADEISNGLDAYKEYAAKTQAKVIKQQSASKRLEAAITPTGTASSPATLSEHDLFLQGFKTP